MTDKGLARQARKSARAAGTALNIERRADGGLVFVAERTPAQEDAHARRMYRWAKRYDALNGAPESDMDR
jgi:hypothetical protein